VRHNKAERRYEKEVRDYIINKVLNVNNLTNIVGTTKNLFETNR